MPKPVIDKEKCDMCGMCITICPVEVFAKEDSSEKKDILVAKPTECIGCRACEAQCPKNAIIVSD